MIKKKLMSNDSFPFEILTGNGKMTQFLRDQASDSEEVVTPLMLDGTYLSRNFATLGPDL